MDESPYESYASQFTRNNFNKADEFKNQNLKPINFDTLNEYFDYLAGYSNNYFFSKGTINDLKYTAPKILKEIGQFGYGLDKNSEEFTLVGIETRIVKEGDGYKNIKIYLLTEDQLYKPVLDAYFTRLSREAVLTSAGVIDLFFKEAERAEKNPSLLKPPPQNLAMIISVWGGINWVGRNIVSAYDGVKNFAVETWNGLLTASGVPFGGGLAGLADESGRAGPLPETNSEPEFPSNLPVAPSSEEPVISGPAQNHLETPFPSEDVALLSPPPSLAETATADTLPSEQIPEPLFSLTPVPFIGMGGGGSPATSPENTFAVETAAPEETAVATGTAATSTESVIPLPPPDEISPDIFFEITECIDSFSSEACVLFPGDLHLRWGSDAEDLDYYELFMPLPLAGQADVTDLTGLDSELDPRSSLQVSTTTATSTIFSAETDGIYSFSVKAKDINENWSESKTILVEINKLPVVINEIAWAGTQNKPTDEWIELFNNTSAEINFGGWVLFSETDQKPYIELSGAIPAKGYYLIERTADDNTVSDILADWAGPFGSGSGMGLSNSGEVLVLNYASTTIDRTPACHLHPYYGRWCAGSDDTRSMERINTASAGDEPSNWGTNNVIIVNGKGAEPDFFQILGTPKIKNSVSYLLNNNNDISSDLTLTKTRSPYLVNNRILAVQSGVTLTIEPGVVIKFYNGAGMTVFGKIIAEGTADEPIVFTDFYDDESGGDINNDATGTLSMPGSWFGISIKDSVEHSVFDHAVFRYGGNFYTQGSYSQSDLYIENSVASVSNSVFEYSENYGLRLVNSASLVSENIFRNNQAGVSVENSGPAVIASNQFLENDTGLKLFNSAAEVRDNVFFSNTADAVNSYGPLAFFENNSGSGNAVNAIVINGNLSAENGITTMKANPLPYYIWGYGGAGVAASSTLIVEEGTVIKGSDIRYPSRLNIYGNFLVEGSDANEIVFTSAYDDSSGGDTLNDGDNFSILPGQWSGITMYPLSSSNMKGAAFKYADTALTYQNSPINLDSVRFVNNKLAVSADTDSAVSYLANLIFIGNIATTSPLGLFGF